MPASNWGKKFYHWALNLFAVDVVNPRYIFYGIPPGVNRVQSYGLAMAPHTQMAFCQPAVDRCFLGLAGNLVWMGLLPPHRLALGN